MKCPKCGFEQPEDIYCARCGVEVSKWRSGHVVKARLIKLYIAGAALIVVATLVVLIFKYRGNPLPNESSGEALTAKETLGRPSAPGAAPSPGSSSQSTENSPAAAEPASPQPPRPESKPTPEESLPKTLAEETLAQALPSDQASFSRASRKGFRMYSVRDRQMNPIPFQIDSGWTQPAEGNWDASDKILVMASDLGGRDDSAYPPRGFESSWRAEVKGKEGRGWAYLYHFDYSPTLSDKSYIKYSSPDDVAGRRYRVKFAPEHAVAISQLFLGDGPNLIDRQKLRIITKDSILSEDSAQGQYAKSISGPIMSRTRWTGAIKPGPVIPFVVENEYLPDGWKTSYSIDFSSTELQDAAMRLYFDFKSGIEGIRIILPDRPNGVAVDGRPDDVPKSLSGQWFVVAVPPNALRVSLNGSGKLFYSDNASQGEPPDSDAGCFGCVGYEFRAAGSVQFTISYDVLRDYKPENPPREAPPSLTGVIQALEVH